MSSLLRALSPIFLKRSKLRLMLRGYARLRKQGRINLLRRIKSDISVTQLGGGSESLSPLFFGASAEKSMVVVRQYLIDRHAGAGLNRAILLALGRDSKLVYPLPKVWLKVLVDHGLNVCFIRSSLAWMCVLFVYFVRNIVRVSGFLIKSFLVKRQVMPLKPYAYFNGLSAVNLPNLDPSAPSYDVCSWYAKWSGRISHVEIIRHDVVGHPVTSVGGMRVENIKLPPYLLLVGLGRVSALVVWSVVTMVLSGMALICGRWCYAVLLLEAVRSKAVALTSQEFLADDYLFHHSGSAYRPMWTYEAEKKGSRVACYFYSTSEQPKLPHGYETQKFEWAALSWPIYLVWDKYQEELLRRNMNDKPNVLIVGPIFFSTSAQKFYIPPNSVAVFDSEPHRLAFHFPNSTLGDYLVAHPDLNARFLQDVHAVLRETRLNMVLKRKREIGSRTRKSYLRAFRKVAGEGGVVVLPSSLSPALVIEHSLGVISMPFTSTALMMPASVVPSIYYDPTGWISVDDEAAHGVPIIVGIDALRQWVRDTIKPLGTRGHEC